MLGHRVARRCPLLFGTLWGTPARKLRMWKRMLQAMSSVLLLHDLSDLTHKWRDLRGAVCKKLGKSSVSGLSLSPLPLSNGS